MNNGYLNTYSFTKDGKKITLNSLAPSQLHKRPSIKKSDRSNLFLTFSEPPLKASHHEFRTFKDWILTNQGEPEITSPKHPLAMALLQTYGRVFPDEITAGLPAKRDIQHHIDLSPGAVLPNKLAYRMNPAISRRATLKRTIAGVIESMSSSGPFGT